MSEAPRKRGIDFYVWLIWWIGAIIIVLSWTNTVSAVVGWVGFGLCCLSSLASVVLKKYWKPPTDGGGSPAS